MVLWDGQCYLFMKWIVENGFTASYAISSTINNKDVKPDEVRFVWNGHNENNPFRIGKVGSLLVF